MDPDTDSEIHLITPPEETEPLTGCTHDSTQFLGPDEGNNQYHRCTECNAILIIEGNGVSDQRHRVSETGLTNPILDALDLERSGSNRRRPTDSESLQDRMRELWRRVIK